jgi:MoaA/NifB/PqqE/SkfB family radical SAM enzyme
MKRALPVLVPLPGGPRPPPLTPGAGVVSWNMNTTCNYRCSYCTQRFLDDRTRWAADVPRFVKAFASLPEATGVPWEIKLSGGEPFAHPRFMEVVAGLAAHGLSLSVVTNFSFADRIDPFIAAAGDQLRVLSASLHLEYVDARSVDDRFPAPTSKTEPLMGFIARCQQAQQRLSSGSSLVVTVVAGRVVLPMLQTLRAVFASEGVTLKVQPEKQGRDVIDYSDDERNELLSLGGHNNTGVIDHDFGGQWCWAGARYLIVDDRGDTHRCYPARRYRTEALGNVLDEGFAASLWSSPRPCLYRYCNCTVPIARGMMNHGLPLSTQPFTEGV